MFLQILAVRLELLLILFLINISMGQIVFENNSELSPGDNCMTPDLERGTCLRWTQCLSLSQKTEDWDQLRQYMCGFAGDEPIICCPFSLQSNISSTPTDRISPTTNSTRTTNTSSEHVPVHYIPKTNPSGSPGYRLGKPVFLPDVCGEHLETVSNSVTGSRIIGGQEAEKGNWPFMAVVFEIKRSGLKIFQCGGALVTARHVITAAHCLVKRNAITPLDPKQLMVRLGALNLSTVNEPGTIDVGVNVVRIHERYDIRTHRDDIAVLQLSQRAPFSSSIIPVCLPYDSLRDTNLSGRRCAVTGFGLTSVNGSYSDVLMEVSFYIQNQEVCRKSYARDLRITDKQLCAGTLDGSKDACVGKL
ncbi:Proclotting enzyme like protein [Argiope bruennichi]|uniref:CLIP domain-containing serine protease n=1 Tax=Argiope bruennichi TaxID=94029 RepID=A0A8T0FAV1_ARGBR|nr:Proclotting enzyme like protein [Argiope bruennichi]